MVTLRKKSEKVENYSTLLNFYIYLYVVSSKPIKTFCSMTYYFPYSHIISDLKLKVSNSHPYFSGWSISSTKKSVRIEDTSVAIAEIYY